MIGIVLRFRCKTCGNEGNGRRCQMAIYQRPGVGHCVKQFNGLPGTKATKDIVAIIGCAANKHASWLRGT